MKGFKAWIIKLVIKKIGDLDKNKDGVLTLTVKYHIDANKLDKPTVE